MRHALIFSLAPCLAACANTLTPLPSPSQDLHHCRLEHRSESGTFAIDGWMPRDGRPGHLQMGWESPVAGARVTITIMPWDGPDLAGPPDSAETLIAFDMPARGGRAPFILELRRRAATGQPEEVVFRAIPTRARGRLAVMPSWARLRVRAAGRPLEAVIVDRRGLELARDSIDPAIFDEPRRAAAAARAEWELLIRNPANCPVDPPESRVVTT